MSIFHVLRRELYPKVHVGGFEKKGKISIYGIIDDNNKE